MELCFDVLRIFCVFLVGLDSTSAKVASCRFNFPPLFSDKRFLSLSFKLNKDEIIFNSLLKR